MKLSGWEPAASGFLAYVRSWYPSQRSRLDWVPNQRNPCLSWAIAVTADVSSEAMRANAIWPSSDHGRAPAPEFTGSAPAPNALSAPTSANAQRSRNAATWGLENTGLRGDANRQPVSWTRAAPSRSPQQAAASSLGTHGLPVCAPPYPWIG